MKKTARETAGRGGRERGRLPSAEGTGERSLEVLKNLYCDER